MDGEEFNIEEAEGTEKPGDEVEAEGVETQTPAAKDIDDYEYKVRIERVEGDDVTVVCEEVDGYDGFGVTFKLSEIEDLTPDELVEKLEPHVEKRIELLKEVKAREEEGKAKLERIKSKLSRPGSEIKLKPKKKKGRGKK